MDLSSTYKCKKQIKVQVPNFFPDPCPKLSKTTYYTLSIHTRRQKQRTLKLIGITGDNLVFMSIFALDLLPANCQGWIGPKTDPKFGLRAMVFEWPDLGHIFDGSYQPEVIFSWPELPESHSMRQNAHNIFKKFKLKLC